jgi:hypothetical protein
VTHRDDSKRARDQLAANLAAQMEREGMSVEDLARRAEVSTEEMELVLAGEDPDLTATDCIVLAGAADLSFGELFAGISWTPYFDRRGGEFQIPAID